MLLADVAPELGEWAAFFAAGAQKRAAAEAGLPSAVTPREADDLVREVEAFLRRGRGLARRARVPAAAAVRLMDPFVHLHVASGYSLRHGASHPRELVARAAEHGMDTLALTDRDGAYGVVKFAKACGEAGVRPVFGVDLAVAPVRTDAPARTGRATPARGGAFLERPGAALPRVVLLARDGRGWAALCRLVSATHLAGERGTPVSSLELVAEHAGAAAQAGALTVLLGPASELGRAVDARREDVARAHLSRWRDVLGRESVVVEVVCHRGQGDVGRAARMLGFAGSSGRRRSSPTSSATPTAPAPRPPTCSTPRAGWSPSTCATSTAATPRPPCCPARRWASSPSRSPGPPGWPTTAARCCPAPASRPTGARSTRAATSASARSTSPSWRPAGASRRRCCGSGARRASAGAA